MNKVGGKIIVVCMAGCISLSPFAGENASFISKNTGNPKESIYHQVDGPHSSVAAIRTVDTEVAVVLTSFLPSSKYLFGFTYVTS
jgi:hypothetical protein